MIEYLAGIFDAEGYVRIRKNKSGKSYCYTYEARVYMCDKNIVNLFAKNYGLTVKSSNRGLNRKIAYYVCFNGKNLRETSFIDDLLPFLNEKRLQLQEVKNLINCVDTKENCYNNYMIAKKSFNHEIKGELSYEYIAGVIDGDGWFSMFNASKDKGRLSAINRFSFGLEQRYKPMIEYMLKYNGNISKRKLLDSDKHVQTYEWKTTKSDMLDLLISIEPFLIEKKISCLKFINYIKKYKEFKDYSISILSSNDWYSH